MRLLEPLKETEVQAVLRCIPKAIDNLYGMSKV